MKPRTILVTGGNRGIGLAIVEGLAQASEDTILLGCRDTKEGKQIASKIGPNVKAVKLDLSSKDILSEDLAKIRAEHPIIHVLINNAGVLHEGDINQASMGNIEASIQVNTLSPTYLIKELLPNMIENDYGRIVNISSGWGSFDEGLSGPFSYSLSKAAINALTLCVAKDLRGNVKVNSMCPGWVRTRMGGMMATRSPKEGADTALWLANLPNDGPNGGFFRDRKLIDW